MNLIWFDYQLDRHCSKTRTLATFGGIGFDYQLDRHCSKTRPFTFSALAGLITS